MDTANVLTTLFIPPKSVHVIIHLGGSNPSFSTRYNLKEVLKIKFPVL